MCKKRVRRARLSYETNIRFPREISKSDSCSELNRIMKQFPDCLDSNAKEGEDRVINLMEKKKVVSDVFEAYFACGFGQDELRRRGEKEIIAAIKMSGTFWS